MPNYKSVFELSKRSLNRHFKSGNGNTPKRSRIETDSLISSQNDGHLSQPGIVPNDLFIDESDQEAEFLSDLEDVEEVTEKPEDVTAFLIGWSSEYNIKRNALNKLLQFINKNYSPHIPIDSRTLLETPQKRNEIQMSPGKYVHIGLKEHLNHFLGNVCDNELDEISLDFNIDGVPISRSSTSCFWPILCKPHHKKGEVFVVGIYHGYRKPGCFSEFLRPFVDEVKSISTLFFCNDKLIKVTIRAFICDSPARASVTGSKGHTGYFGCGKCTQQGEYLDHRMTFPENNAVLRTNQSFRNHTDDEYHVKTTPILEIESVDMVKQFPLDYLHLVLLGVVKKLLNMWLKGKPPFLLPTKDEKRISEKLVNAAHTQPMEFQRKVRPLSEIGYFKGSEFRTFLLYTGPYALKNIIPEDQYNHFISLHISITILCHPELYKTKNTIAKKLLENFVTRFGEIYGMEHLIYNVHGLIHLSDECLHFGTLDSFSAFPFESYMQDLKKLLYKNNQPLSQISNRIYENLNFNLQKNKNEIQNYPKFKKATKPNDDGIVYYEKIVFEHFTLDKSPKNMWFLTKTKRIVRFDYFSNENRIPVIHGFELPYKQDYYKLPLNSSKLDIFKAKNEEREIVIALNQISKKLFSMKQSSNDIIFFPLIHQTYY